MAKWRSKKIRGRMDFLQSIQLDPNDVDRWSEKWINKRKSAKSNSIEFTLSFEDYIQKAKDAGLSHPHQIGLHIGNYALGRLGDVGGYTKDNCRFITVEQNLQELIDNGGYQRSSDKQKGRSKDSHAYLKRISDIRKTHTAETQEWVRIRAEKIRGRTTETDAGVAEATEKQSYGFELTSPNGEVYVGINLSKFCRENKHLGVPTQSAMASVCRGEKPSCNGWVGNYISKDGS